MENQIGAGLIEEVIQVAEGELKLVDTMLESRMYVTSFLSVHHHTITQLVICSLLS